MSVPSVNLSVKYTQRMGQSRDTRGRYFTKTMKPLSLDGSPLFVHVGQHQADIGGQ